MSPIMIAHHLRSNSTSTRNWFEWNRKVSNWSESLTASFREFKYEFASKDEECIRLICFFSRRAIWTRLARYRNHLKVLKASYRNHVEIRSLKRSFSAVYWILRETRVYFSANHWSHPLIWNKRNEFNKIIHEVSHHDVFNHLAMKPEN